MKKILPILLLSLRLSGGFSLSDIRDTIITKVIAIINTGKKKPAFTIPPEMLKQASAQAAPLNKEDNKTQWVENAADDESKCAVDSTSCLPHESSKIHFSDSVFLKEPMGSDCPPSEVTPNQEISGNRCPVRDYQRLASTAALAALAAGGIYFYCKDFCKSAAPRIKKVKKVASAIALTAAGAVVLHTILIYILSR